MAQHPLGFSYYKDKPTPDLILKRRKLSIGSNGSDSTGEKVELNESFNRLNLGVLSTSVEFKKPNISTTGISFPKPIKPTAVKAGADFQSPILIGIQKYLKLGEDYADGNAAEILKQPFQQLQRCMENATRVPEPRSRSNSEHRNQRKAPFFYAFGIPANFEQVVDEANKFMKNEIELETQRQLRQREEQHMEQLLLRSGGGGELVGRLTKEQRAEKVRLYKEKKLNRQWRQVKYSVRKNLADQRERQQGRFVKSQKPSFNQSLVNLQQSDDRKDEKNERKLNSLANSYQSQMSA